MRQGNRSNWATIILIVGDSLVVGLVSWLAFMNFYYLLYATVCVLSSSILIGLHDDEVAGEILLI